MTDRKISSFARVSALASGYIVPLLDLSQATLTDQNIAAPISTFDDRYVSISGGSVTNPFAVPAGTVTAPGLGVGTTDKGLYAPSATTVGVAAGNVQAVAFGSGLTAINNSVTVSGTVLASGGTASRPGLALFQFNTGFFADGTSLNGAIAGTGVFTANQNNFVIPNSVVLSGGNSVFNGTVVVSGGVVNNVGLGVASSNTGLFRFDQVTLSTAVSGIEVVRVTPTTFRFLKEIVADSTVSGSNFVATSGSQNSPSYAVGDADTGIFLVDANTLGVAAGGNEITRFGNNGVVTFAGSGAVDIPVGTTAQRPSSSSQGMLRFNTTSNRFEGYNGTLWTSVGGGATGSGFDEVFILNQTVVSGSYTIPDGYNAMSTGPLTISSGVVVTVNSGSAWSVI